MWNKWGARKEDPPYFTLVGEWHIKEKGVTVEQ